MIAVTELIPCEFFILRYVPDIVKGEFVNFGIILRNLQPKFGTEAGASTHVRVTRDWTRVRSVHPHVDLRLLSLLEEEIQSQVNHGHSWVYGGPHSPTAVLDFLQDNFSNSIQISGPHASLAKDIEGEIDRVMRMYVGSLSVTYPIGLAGRPLIVNVMRSEFERAGVWPVIWKRFGVAKYTAVGDPTKIDAGYAVVRERLIRLFHCVSLEKGVTAAQALAFSASSIRDGVRRVEERDLILTAIIEPRKSIWPHHSLRPDYSFEDELESEVTDHYGFGISILTSAGIRVITMDDLPSVAKAAHAEIGL